MNPDEQIKVPAQPGDVEPTVALTPTPVWPFVLLGILFFGSQLYMDKFSGGFRADVYAETLKQPPPLAAEPPEVKLARKGREYYGTCAGCHQPSGLGVAGQFPPLAGSEWTTAPNANRMVRIILDGLQGPIKVKGQDWAQQMPPLRDAFSDEMIAAVISFVRSNKEWGHSGSAITPEQVKAIRDATAAHAGNAWTGDELQKVPDGR